MKGITVYNNKFAIWRTHLRDELPDLDGTADPMVWFGKCLSCKDVIVCGVSTKRECIEAMEKHVVEDAKEYTVHDVISAGCTLEPMVCLHCEGSEVTFDQYIGDAYCADCGRWQLEKEETK